MNELDELLKDLLVQTPSTPSTPSTSKKPITDTTNTKITTPANTTSGNTTANTPANTKTSTTDKSQQQSFLPKCAFCNEPIKGKCINALEQTWHPQHFFCSQCGKEFLPGCGFMEHDGKAYCEEDYNQMFAPKCAVCDEPILDQVITALGKSFHPPCFTCQDPNCHLPLSNTGTFYDYNGKAYCEKHYHLLRGSFCNECQKPIVGKCLSALGKKFHFECFKCGFCKKGLTGGGGATFKEKDEKAYCVGCFIKLYG